MKILISILTFNRLNLLKRCLNHINQLTYQNFELLIVDNGSTDGTKDFLIKKKINHISNQASGSALGWHKCIQHAFKNDYDFIWMMDDDGYPKNNSLEILINEFTKMKDDTVCLSSTLVSEVNFNNLVFNLPKKPRSLFKSQYKKLNEIKVPFINHVHLFNGALFKIESLKKIGNVDTNFFHHGVEVDYHYRLKKNFNVYTVVNAIHYHPEVNSRAINKMWVYYYLKNSIITNYKYSKFPLVKTIIHICLCILRINKRNGFRELFSYLIGKKNNIFYLSIYDGLKNKMVNKML